MKQYVVVDVLKGSPYALQHVRKEEGKPARVVGVLAQYKTLREAAEAAKWWVL